MTPIKERVRDHRKREREYVRSARHFIKTGDYELAIRYLAWAVRQQGAADIAEVCLGIVNARDAMAAAKPVTPRAKEK